jgi:imidazolonepropionase-like amidohydrolase
MRTTIAAALFLLLLCACASAPNTAVAPAPAAQLAIVGGTVYTSPAAPPIENAVVLVRNGRIAEVGRGSVPPGTPTVDARGGIVTAGFWNSHVHLFGPDWNASRPAAELESLLHEHYVRRGFTSLVDTGSLAEQTVAIRSRIERGELRGPRILTTGEPIFPKGGTPPLITSLGLHAPEISDPTEAPALVTRQLARGADAIKLYLVSWMVPGRPAMTRDQIAALTRAAHLRHTRVIAHPQSLEALEAAVDAGIDLLAHTTPESGPWSERLVESMIAKNVALIPTLSLWRTELRDPRGTTVAIEQLRAFQKAGGEVLFGTDAGYTPDTDPEPEYALMRESGMSFEAILASLTVAPARAFGRGTGRLERGAEADLVILDGRDFTRVRVVVRAGTVLHPPPARTN